MACSISYAFHSYCINGHYINDCYLNGYWIHGDGVNREGITSDYPIAAAPFAKAPISTLWITTASGLRDNRASGRRLSNLSVWAFYPVPFTTGDLPYAIALCHSPVPLPSVCHLSLIHI